jgi:hypothetical protein
MGITIEATSHAMFAAPQVRATRLMASVAFLVKMISSKPAVKGPCENTKIGGHHRTYTSCIYHIYDII